MNWIKDFIPTIKRNISQTFGEEKDSKIKSGKVDKKNKEIKETAISEEIAVPDDPGVVQEEDIHEP